MSCDWERVLVIAPHSDDMELGCGGFVARMCFEGVEVTELIMATGDLIQSHKPEVTPISIRREEAERAAEFLGVRRVEFAFTEESRLDTVAMARGTSLIQSLIDDLMPNAVLLPLRSAHQDHRWVHDCAVAALRPWRVGHHPTAILGYEYPLLFWGGYDQTEMTLYVDITAHMTTKIMAVNVYQSQLRPGPLSSVSVDTYCRQRGTECGAEYAERFKLIRMKV
jgi:LmbE family N-acetylglucosaminyl deacetylase